ncbi:hypothetical protein OHS33_35165 [Streptomyces sp. NBC_00536]|uniref:hypothetical protein n=1 Tax=Streptomyces sp. NBC_00536 TaxID=2975769 RepID=UPI002E81C3A1|nr:hypothetical protein [Streptomyces sp. NBC_00536]WUC83155.1 hypothetical protein OHS33_35165 [Streptomyces sp. NBC_00536]
MQNLGLEQRGHVLLIAGGTAVHRRAVQVAPSANLAALGVVPAAMLLNSGLSCDTTYLDGARDPNLVLTRLRTAAATRGPLLVYLSGRLTLDRRGRRLHLALAGTTPGSVRYTALPWEWLGTELRDRPAGLTTVLLDLVADKAAWPLLQEYGSLPSSPSAEVYGVVSPPGFSGSGNTVSSYTRCWIEQLAGSPGRPANLQLHALAAGAAALPPGTLVLPTARELAAPAGSGPHAPAVGSGIPGQVLPDLATPPEVPATAPATAAAQQGEVPPPTASVDAVARDPRPHIHALATAGRHTEAAALAQAWEEYVLQHAGYGTPEAISWLEIRADLARMAGTFGPATQLWTSAGLIRLASQSPDAPEVHAAAAGALHCWTQLRDPATAIGSAPELIRLLRALPSLDSRHIKLAQQRLEFLHRAPSGL